MSLKEAQDTSSNLLRVRWVGAQRSDGAHPGLWIVSISTVHVPCREHSALRVSYCQRPLRQIVSARATSNIDVR